MTREVQTSFRKRHCSLTSCVATIPCSSMNVYFKVLLYLYVRQNNNVWISKLLCCDPNLYRRKANFWRTERGSLSGGLCRLSFSIYKYIVSHRIGFITSLKNPRRCANTLNIVKFCFPMFVVFLSLCCRGFSMLISYALSVIYSFFA
jgi:hypothetical protein